jgi:tetratricopeptide (TPR) repeat protein
MSRIPRLLMIIPANARPDTDIDLRALAAPVGKTAPAHLRARFQRQAQSKSPSIGPVSTPGPVTPVAEFQPATDDDDPELQTAAATLGAAPPAAPEMVLDKPVSAKLEAKAAEQTFDTTVASLEEPMNEESQGETYAVQGKVLPPIEKADHVFLESDAPEALDTATETQRLANDVSRFVEQEEELAAAAAAPFSAIDDDEELGSLSGGVLAGFGTLAMAVLTLLLLTTAAFFVWDHYSQDPQSDLKIASNNNPVMPIDIMKDNPENSNTHPRTPSSSPTLKPAVAVVPKPEIDPDQEIFETPTAAKADTKKEERIPDLGFGQFVGIEEESEAGDYPGFAFKSQVGVEEDEPGLINQIETLRAQAVTAERAERWGEALKRYSKILAIKPQDIDSLFRSGTIHYKTANYDEAEVFYKRSLNIDPGLSKARNNFGLVLLARGQVVEARKAFEVASKQANPDALTNLGNEYARDGKSLTAASYYRKALVIQPDHAVARYGLALALLDEDEAKAREHFEALAERQGVGAKAQMMLGKMAHDKNQISEALRRYKRALELDPKLIEARMNYAMALVRDAKAEAAVKQLRLVVAERPKDSIAWTNMGIALMKSGDRGKAKQCYEYALNLDKRNPAAHFNYALCAESFGNYLIALEEYEESLKLDKFYWQAAYNMGLIYLKGNKYQEALNQFDQSISIRGNHAPAHLNRAKVLFGLRRIADGQSALKTYLLLAPKSDPNRKIVKQRLDAMEANNQSSNGERTGY